MTQPPNVVIEELRKKLERKDKAMFARLLTTGPLTRRLDLIAAALNAS